MAKNSEPIEATTLVQNCGEKSSFNISKTITPSDQSTTTNLSKESGTNNNANKVVPLPHHEAHQLCLSRPEYRQGRKLTSVKVYTINDESVYLIINGVPSVKLQRELCNLCQRYGSVLALKKLPDYPCSAFSEVYMVKYSNVKEARFAKKLLDQKNFFGGVFHVCYAPELETVEETFAKLNERRKCVKDAIMKNSANNQRENSNKNGSGSSVLSKYHPDDKLSASIKRIGDRLTYGGEFVSNEQNSFVENGYSEYNNANGTTNTNQMNIEVNGSTDNSYSSITVNTIPQISSSNECNSIGSTERIQSISNYTKHNDPLNNSPSTLPNINLQYPPPKIANNSSNNSNHDPSLSVSTEMQGSIPSQTASYSTTSVANSSSNSNFTSSAAVGADNSFTNNQDVYGSYSSVAGSSSNSGPCLPCSGLPSSSNIYSSMSASYESGIGEVSNETYSNYTKTTYKKNKKRVLNYKGNEIKNEKPAKKPRKNNNIRYIFSTEDNNKNNMKDNFSPREDQHRKREVKSQPSDPSNPRVVPPKPTYTKVLCGPRPSTKANEQLMRLQTLLNDSMGGPPTKLTVRDAPIRSPKGRMVLAPGAKLL